MYPKILIATPTSSHKDYCLDEWARFVCSLTYPNLEVLIVDNSRDKEHFKITHETLCKENRKYKGNIIINTQARPLKENETLRECMTECNEITRKYALDNGFDYMLSLESDIFTIPDIIQRLLSYDKHVVGIPYYYGHGVHSKLLASRVDRQNIGNDLVMRGMHLDESFVWLDGKLKQARQFGLGCVLIHKSILKMFPFRCDINDPDKSNADVFFHADLMNANIPAYLDTSIIATHKNINWNDIAKIEKI